MSKKWLAVLALAGCVTLSTPAALADRPEGKGKGKGNPHAARDRDDDDHGWERRGGYEYRVYDRDGHPPGWSQGKKTGWGNCGFPPGQAKKYGCRSYVVEGRPHYYYQDEGGRIIVRRPVISVHGGIDVH
jgi:hypothetical protein